MLEIRRAKKEDIQALSQLFDEYRIFYKMKSDIQSATNFIRARLLREDSIIFIAVHSNVVCGFIQIYPAFSSVAMKPIWILNDLFVNKSFRQKGCAKSLMQHINKKAKTRGVFSIKLATAINNKQAKNLYESLNYLKIDSFDYYSLKL